MLQMFTGAASPGSAGPGGGHGRLANAGGQPRKVCRAAQEHAPLGTLRTLFTSSSAFATFVIIVLVTYSGARADTDPEQDR